MLQFRIVHIAYVVALIAISLATFGVPGLSLAFSAWLLWSLVFTSSSRPRVMLTTSLLVLNCCLVIHFMWPVFSSPPATSRSRCPINIRRIVWALANYERQYGSYPPPYIPDKTGKPMHSWRVLLLPFLREQQLYDKYNFDEPWNGPNNIKLVNSMPDVYSCPSSTDRQANGRGCTSYLAVVGPDTMWPSSSPRKRSEITDKAGDTVVVIEYHDPQIMWLEPRDLGFDEALQILATEDWMQVGSHGREDFFYQRTFGHYVGIVDSQEEIYVHCILSRNTWSALLKVNDGTRLDAKDLVRAPVPSRPKIINWIRVSVFVLVVLIPLPWVWLNPASRVVSSH